MQDVAGFGLQARVIGSKTFPAGFTITEFPDDIDPFDLPALQINDAAMGLNGDLIVWSKANPLNFTLGIIPALKVRRIWRCFSKLTDLLAVSARPRTSLPLWASTLTARLSPCQVV